MIFARPTKHKVTNFGFTEKYHLDSNNISLSIGTISGGYKRFYPVEEDSVLYILQGIGSATLKEKEIHIDGEKIIEIPAHSFFKLEHGQYRYIYARNVSSYSMNENKGKTHFEASSQQRILYVLDGIGNATVDGQTGVLKEGYLMEFPMDTEAELTGNFTYLLFNS